MKIRAHSVSPLLGPPSSLRPDKSQRNKGAKPTLTLAVTFDNRNRQGERGHHGGLWGFFQGQREYEKNSPWVECLDCKATSLYPRGVTGRLQSNEPVQLIDISVHAPKRNPLKTRWTKNAGALIFIIPVCAAMSLPMPDLRSMPFPWPHAGCRGAKSNPCESGKSPTR